MTLPPLLDVVKGIEFGGSLDIAPSDVFEAIKYRSELIMPLC